jgi:DNA-binding transcriptional MerR regulator
VDVNDPTDTSSTTPGTEAGTEAGPAPSQGPSPVSLQGSLFDELPAEERPGGRPEDVGYRGPTACSAAGITYRQLDYWARTGLVEPTVREATGSGSQRLYSFRDILVLKVVKKLLDAGVSLPNIRTAVAALRDRGAEDLAQVTLLSDGTTVYECTSPDEVVDLLQGGQAVFAIAVGRQVRDVEGTLAHLPGERAHPEQGAPAAEHASDELASRRRRRTTA